MFEMKNKLPPLTEEDKSLVRNYFATGDNGGWWESRIRFTYGRMRAHWERIPDAELVLERKKQLKMDAYKQSKEQEIANGLHAYENEHDETGEYERMKINDWASGRTLIIWILGYDGKKVTHSHTVEINEAMNPDYFKECMLRYAPNQALSTDKPF